MHCLYGGYNLHRFSDALGLVKNAIYTCCIYHSQNTLCHKSAKLGHTLKWVVLFKNKYAVYTNTPCVNIVTYKGSMLSLFAIY